MRAGHYYNRIWVITAGCILWGIMTAGFATTHSVAQASDASSRCQCLCAHSQQAYGLLHGSSVALLLEMMFRRGIAQP